MCALSCFSRVWLFVMLWTVACQAPLSMGFSRQEYWSGLPFPLPGHLPDPWIEPSPFTSPALVGGFFIASTTWEASSSHLQSFPASGSFPMSQFFASGGQSIGASASASVLPVTIQDWFPLGWTGWISSASHVAKAWLSLKRPIRGACRGGTGSEAPLLCPLWHSDSQSSPN